MIVNRKYSLHIRDINGKLWQVIFREKNNDSVSFEPQTTLARIDLRTTDFKNEDDLFNYILKQAYVMEDATGTIKLGSSDKEILKEQVLVLGPHKDDFEKSLKCKLRHIERPDYQEFTNAFVRHRSNGSYFVSRIIYSEEQELKGLAKETNYSNKVDTNNPLVTKTIKDFYKFISTNSGRRLRFLLGEDANRKNKYRYMTSYLYQVVLDYQENPNRKIKLDEKLTSYKTIRNLYLGMKDYEKTKINIKPKEEKPRGKELTGEQNSLLAQMTQEMVLGNITKEELLRQVAIFAAEDDQQLGKEIPGGNQKKISPN